MKVNLKCRLIGKGFNILILESFLYLVIEGQLKSISGVRFDFFLKWKYVFILITL